MPHRQQRILLVEDNLADVRLVQIALGAAVKLTVANSLTEALVARAAGDEFDVILLDLFLPDSFGFATVPPIRSAFPATPIVVLTGLDDPALEIQTVESGAQEYLIKGRFGDDGLVRAIRHAIARQALENRLVVSESEHRTIVRLAPDSILVVTKDGVICAANPSAARMFERHGPEDLTGELLGNLLPDAVPLLAADRSGGEVRADGRGMRGAISFPVSMAVAPLGAGRVMVMAQDITERVLLTDRLEQMARTDPLTGLSNRRVLVEAAEAEFKRCKRAGGMFALLMIDIDHFKRVNDVYGHEGGDQALISLANIFSASVRETDLVARYGGEEFVFLLTNTAETGAAEMSERLRASVESNVTDLGGQTLTVTISIGVSSFSRADEDWFDVMRRADQALYEAKASGRNQVRTKPRVLESLEGDPSAEDRTDTDGH